VLSSQLPQEILLKCDGRAAQQLSVRGSFWRTIDDLRVYSRVKVQTKAKPSVSDKDTAVISRFWNRVTTERFSSDPIDKGLKHSNNRKMGDAALTRRIKKVSCRQQAEDDKGNLCLSLSASLEAFASASPAGGKGSKLG
jgi:hypothetical protein